MKAATSQALERLIDVPEVGGLRARLTMLQAALGALRGPVGDYVESRQQWPGDHEDEAFRWLGAFQQAVEQWMGGVRSDMEDYEPYLEAGGETPEVGFGPGCLAAWQRFTGAYADWCAASSLMDNLDTWAETHESEGSRIDALEGRMAARAAGPAAVTPARG